MPAYMALIAALLLGACAHVAPMPLAPAAPSEPPQYALPGTEVHRIKARESGRIYPLYIALPPDYPARPGHRFPVLFVTDAPYAFPLVRAITSRLPLENFILVGLGYAEGETRQFSRRRDYTPTPHGDVDAVSDMPGRPVRYGEADAYARHITTEILPYVATHFRADMNRLTYAGHSYGGLFGAHILLTRPETFQKYILLSPSLWYGRHVILARERAWAMRHRHMPAEVFLAIGSNETTPVPDEEPRRDSAYDMVGDMQRFEAQLREHAYEGLTVTSAVIPDEDHLSVYPAAITRGLKWAFER